MFPFVFSLALPLLAGVNTPTAPDHRQNRRNWFSAAAEFQHSEAEDLGLFSTPCVPPVHPQVSVAQRPGPSHL